MDVIWIKFGTTFGILVFALIFLLNTDFKARASENKDWNIQNYYTARQLACLIFILVISLVGIWIT